MEVLEWVAPPATLWSEAGVASGHVTYVSKLDQFREFLTRAGRFRALSLSGPTGVQAREEGQGGGAPGGGGPPGGP